MEFSANLWEWRGPAPFYFLSLPVELAEEIKSSASLLSYGWGMIPVVATIQGRTFKTSMFSKNGTYVLPVKSEVRVPLNLEPGQNIAVSLTVGS